MSMSIVAGVLDVFHCVLVDSPEALNVIREQHIRTIISLIDKHGRDPKVPGETSSIYVFFREARLIILVASSITKRRLNIVTEK